MRTKRSVRTWPAALLLVMAGVPASAAWAGGGPSATVSPSARGPWTAVPAAARGPSPGAPAPGAGASVPAVGRLWPVGVRPTVVRGWEPPATPYGPGHRGVDLAAAAGDPVRAVAAGRVTFAGRVAGRGVVAVDLTGTGDPPLRTTYEPVRASVREGDEVDPGDVLGVLEPSTAHCPGPCLHWGLRRGETYLDPLSLLPPWLLRAGPSRLLPVEGVPVPVAGP
ncbi:murein hydrolase activator EnvC family protein [Streptomyces sp. NPDC001848]|uniref:murein hydrolase activator EnvC family protein n=1 Tax=Streptomyces sp. NPDC001848 TaxID=3364618 RepID=UPI0036AA09D6